MREHFCYQEMRPEVSRNKMALGLQLLSNSTWGRVYTHILKFIVREKIHQSK